MIKRLWNIGPGMAVLARRRELEALLFEEGMATGADSSCRSVVRGSHITYE